MRDGQEDDINGDKQDIGGNCEFMYIHRPLIDKDLHECKMSQLIFHVLFYMCLSSKNLFIFFIPIFFLISFSMACHHSLAHLRAFQ